MRKLKFFFLITLTLILACITGCTDKKAHTSLQPEASAVTRSEAELLSYTYDYSELGFTLTIPADWRSLSLENVLIQYNHVPYGMSLYFMSREDVQTIRDIEDNLLTIEEEKAFNETLPDRMRPICAVLIGEKENTNKEYLNFIKEFKSVYSYDDFIGANGNQDYHFLYNNNFSPDELSDEAVEMLKELAKDLQQVKDSIEVFTPKTPQNALLETGQISFDTQTLDKTAITQEIFREYGLTAMCFWSIESDFCMEELKNLQEIGERNPSILILGVPIEGDEGNADSIQGKLRNNGVTFLNILPNDQLREGVMNAVSIKPTTIFITSDGTMTGEPMLGSFGKTELEKEITGLMRKGGG
ncbi:hypothetical protein [Hydrogenoanaerobacterium sp.]|uniref:TlpA family protein disulfide reductase n=1 Tax=Hydrogenoanaerobacterium sp. TaxID=2953763 RepID=UPI00289A4DFC|nr:hypothetical protein [Hydrogenoanaerobacterium sp.]